VVGEEDPSRDLAELVVPRAGRLVVTGDRYLPYRMLGLDGMTVEPVTGFFRDLLAAGRSVSTVRSYGMDLLRWFRFLWATGVAWDRATRADARDFSRWLRYGRAGQGVRTIGACAQRDGAAAFLRLLPGRRHRPGDQPVPAGSVPEGPAGLCPSQSDGALPPPAQRALPAESPVPHSAQHPRSDDAGRRGYPG
jgi:hypothetical protein